MKTENFCQSCSMPLNQPESFGTETDGSKNPLYCNYCYQKGAFTNRTITLEGMKKLVTDQMHKMKMDDALIKKTMVMLPSLKRWKNKNVPI
jgi:hypothetical protein